MDEKPQQNTVHVRAQFNLGSMYLTGRGVVRDLGKARTWLEKAAARGI